MSHLKPGTLCVIVAGCPENIGLIVEVISHLGRCPPREDAYRVRTVTGKDFPQLWDETAPTRRLSSERSSDCITDRHKLRPLVGCNDEMEEYDKVEQPDEEGRRVTAHEPDPAGTVQEKAFAATQRQMLNKFVQASSEGKSLAEMDDDVALWWWNRY